MSQFVTEFSAHNLYAYIVGIDIIHSWIQLFLFCIYSIGVTCVNKEVTIEDFKALSKAFDDAPVQAPTMIYLYNAKTDEVEGVPFSEMTEQKLIDMGHDINK